MNKNIQNHTQNSTYLRLPQVLEIIPIGKSSWWAGVKSGRYPKSVKLGPRTTAWRKEDIDQLIVALNNGGEA
jgi:predicted DNA-binding transcriptional regulator AlpA